MLQYINSCCNSQNPLIDIVFFGLSLSGFSSRFFQHPYEKCFFCSSCNWCWISQSTHFRAQCSHSHTAQCPPPSGLSVLSDTLLGVWLLYHLKQLKPTATRYCPLWNFPSGLPLKVFKTCLLDEGFHTLIKNVSFTSPTDVRSHNPPSFET